MLVRRFVVSLFACAASPLFAQEGTESAETPPPRPEPQQQQPAPRRGSDPVAVTRAMVRDLAWRGLGPANPVGRITDLDVHASDRSRWIVGTAGGGVFVTENAGTTWRAATDGLPSASIGDVAIAASDPKIVWIGTGEENARNSVQWGDGVYKSTDGGTTWRCMGLRQTFQIGHIAIHPTNPDVVFVAALGRLWGSNPERGVFRTRDGGTTWERVLWLDDKTGAIDVRLDPQQPDLVYACLYERQRDEFDGNDPAVRFGPGSSLWKSTDGGDNWQKLTEGLPSCAWGRSGLDVFAADPKTLFLIVETERSGWASGDYKDRKPGDPIPQEETERNRQRQQGGAGGPGGGGMPNAVIGIGREGEDGKKDAPGAVLTTVSEGGAAEKCGLKPGDRITQIGDKTIAAFDELVEYVGLAQPGQQAKVTWVRGTETMSADITFEAFGQRGGAQNGTYSGGMLFGQIANRHDVQGPNGHETGGVFRSDDRGETWRRVNSLTERPFYYSVIRVDPNSKDHVYCVGTTMWASSDGGSKFAGINRDIHVDFHTFWIDPADGKHLLAGCDGGVNESFDRGASWQVHTGFSVAQYYDISADNSVPYNVVGGLQDNGTWVGPSRTRFRDGIAPADWCTIYGGDGFGAQTDPVEPWLVFATSQGGALGLVDLRSGNQVRVERQRPPQGTTARFNWDAPFVLSPHNRLLLWSAGNFLYRGDRYAHLDNRAQRADQGPVRNGSSLRAEICSPHLGRTDKGTATSLCESPRVRGLVYVGTDDGALWRMDPDGEWTQLHANLPGLPGPRYVSDIVASHHQDDRVYVALDGHRSDDLRTWVFASEDRGATWRSLATGLPSSEPCYAIAEDPRQQHLLFLGTEYGCHVSLDRGEHWEALGQGLPTVAVRDLCLHDRDGDLIAATHGRGVWVLDIAPLRQFDAAVATATGHLFAPEDAIRWSMRTRSRQGHRDLRAPNPPYGASLHVWFAAVPEQAPTIVIRDVTGKQVASVEGAKKSGLQTLQWDARSGRDLTAPGTYAACLQVGDTEQKRIFRLLPDPATAANTAEPSTTTMEAGR